MYTEIQLMSFATYCQMHQMHSAGFNLPLMFSKWSKFVENKPSIQQPATSERPAPSLKTKPFNLEEWIKGGSKVEDVCLRNGDKIQQISYFGTSLVKHPIYSVIEDGSVQKATLDGIWGNDGKQSDRDLMLIDRSEPVYVWRNVYLSVFDTDHNQKTEHDCVLLQFSFGEKNIAICRLKLEETAPGQYKFIEAISY